MGIYTVALGIKLGVGMDDFYFFHKNMFFLEKSGAILHPTIFILFLQIAPYLRVRDFPTSLSGFPTF